MATIRPNESTEVPAVRPEIVVTAHAEQMLKARGIKLEIVKKAIFEGKSRIDGKSGREVFRAGDLRIVAMRDENRVTILTVVDAGDFAEYAG
jgi:hypothetical protein